MGSNVILGVSNLDVRSHDNAACILVDGELQAQAEEERFTRKKHAYDSLPINAIRFCLEKAGLVPEDVQDIAIGWDLPNTTFDKKQMSVLKGDTSSIVRDLLGENIAKKMPAVHFVPHHLAHASIAYLASGYRSAAVLVVDGAGEVEATTLWHGKDASLNKLHSKDQNPHSLGFMYEGVSEYLGFHGNEAGKVMGLAAYHEEKVEPFDVFTFENGYDIRLPKEIKRSVIKDFAEKENYFTMERITECWIRYCESLFGPREQFHMKSLAKNDIRFAARVKIAAILQTSLEAALLSTVQFLKDQAGENKLCLSGGVALNCSANGKLDKGGLFDEIYTYPASNDSGVALGAALHIHHQRGGRLANPTVSHNPFWGPEFSDEEILEFLKQSGMSFEKCDEDFADIAELIASGKVVAWFQGAMEIGPRALGGRSILADPRDPSMTDRVNKIKDRELWRPLAPSILRGYEQEYFSPGVFSPFMLRAATVKEEKRRIIPAVTHVDQSSRYQSVCKETNPRYWQLIESFRQSTGVPMVLNTSFNHKEPIVCTPEDALRTFAARDIEHLVVGRFKLRKLS